MENSNTFNTEYFMREFISVVKNTFKNRVVFVNVHLFLQKINFSLQKNNCIIYINTECQLSHSVFILTKINFRGKSF